MAARDEAGAAPAGVVVIGLFADPETAAQAIRQLKEVGFTDQEIGAILRKRGPTGDVVPEVVAGEDLEAEADAVKTGAATGGIIGAVLGLLGSLLIPGLGPVTLGGLTASVPAAHDQVQWSRQPSFGRYGRPAVPVPTCDFPLCAVDGNAPARQLPHDMLVGTDCPSFPGVDQAWRAFFEDDFSLTGTNGARQELGLIRIAATDAWLGRVHISATELSVQIHGDQIEGCRLELFGKTGRSERELDASGLVVVALDEGLPEDAWLWLKRGTSWLDYRAFSP